MYLSNLEAVSPPARPSPRPARLYVREVASFGVTLCGARWVREGWNQARTPERKEKRAQHNTTQQRSLPTEYRG